MRGSIRKRGNAWELRFDVASPSGERRTRSVAFKGTRQEAQRELTKLLAQSDAGTLPDPCNATAETYVTAWLDGAQVSPRTLERYREIAAKQIAPHLGAHKLNKLRAEHVRLWHGTLRDTGLSPRSVLHAHALLSRVLAEAVRFGTLANNACEICGRPKVEDTELEILSPDQVGEVLTTLEGHSLFPIVTLALNTGMRRGELLGLQWGDVDLDAATLRVERSVEETKAGLRLKAPKTRRGRRNLKLPADAVAMLRTHKAAQLRLRLALGMGNIEPGTLVFSTVDGGLIRPRNLSKSWWRTRQALNLPSVSFHAFRHSHASLLIRQGVDILTISRRLGHAQPSITLNVYGHLFDGADDAAAAAMERSLK